MRVLILVMIAALTSCGDGNVSRKETSDSIAKHPTATPQQQIPGTPGPAGSDSTRMTPTEHAPNDSAR